jgi:hypothetical protein
MTRAHDDPATEPVTAQQAFEQDADSDFLDEEWLEPRRTSRLTKVLVGLVLVSLGFLAGVSVGRGAADTAAAQSAARPTAARSAGGGGGGGGAQGGQAGGGSGGTGGGSSASQPSDRNAPNGAGGRASATASPGLGGATSAPASRSAPAAAVPSANAPRPTSAAAPAPAPANNKRRHQRARGCDRRPHRAHDDQHPHDDAHPGVEWGLRLSRSCLSSRHDLSVPPRRQDRPGHRG